MTDREGAVNVSINIVICMYAVYKYIMEHSMLKSCLAIRLSGHNERLLSTDHEHTTAILHEASLTKG